MNVFILIPLCFTLLVGCSSSPHIKVGKSDIQESPKALYDSVLAAGRSIKSVHGNVWLKTYSKEVSGQFSANVEVTALKQVKLEITNILGGIEALITVDDQRYEVSEVGSRDKKLVKNQGFGSWGGIPLNWAATLFLGKIPYPNDQDKLQLSLNADQDLVVLVGGREGRDSQKFTYHFRYLESGKPWPESLHWEKQSPDVVSVDFKFDDPEVDSLSPRKWEARSLQGAVKVRWKDRDVIKL